MVTAGQEIMVMVADYAEFIIRRPNGDVETVRHPTCRELNDVLFAHAKKATKAAGRGDILSYNNVQKAAVYTVTAADAATDRSARIEKLMSAGE